MRIVTTGRSKRGSRTTSRPPNSASQRSSQAIRRQPTELLTGCAPTTTCNPSSMPHLSDAGRRPSRHRLPSRTRTHVCRRSCGHPASFSTTLASPLPSSSAGPNKPTTSLLATSDAATLLSARVAPPTNSPATLSRSASTVGAPLRCSTLSPKAAHLPTVVKMANWFCDRQNADGSWAPTTFWCRSRDCRTSTGRQPNTPWNLPTSSTLSATR